MPGTNFSLDLISLKEMKVKLNSWVLLLKVFIFSRVSVTSASTNNKSLLSGEIHGHIPITL